MNGEEKTFIIKPDPSLAIEKLKPLCQCKCNWLGVALIVIGILWYLRNIQVLPADLLWPLVFVVVGVICLIKVRTCKT